MSKIRETIKNHLNTGITALQHKEFVANSLHTGH